MNLPLQISRCMSLREPQEHALSLLSEVSDGIDYRNVLLDSVAVKATEKAAAGKTIEFDTQFPSFCFALATGVGKTRLMGASMYYFWKTKGYQYYYL
jgi:type III restriction enzyme